MARILRQAIWFFGGLAIGLILARTFREPAPRGSEPKPEKLMVEPTPVMEKENTFREAKSRGETGREPSPLALASELLSALPEGVVPAGRGAIWGRVLTDLGQPLGGVQVSLEVWPLPWPEPEDFGWSSLAEGSDERAVFREVARMKREMLGRKTTETDAQGFFRIDGLSESLGYRIGASLPGWSIGPLAGAAESVRTSAEVVLVARRRVEVAVTCLLPDGTEPESADISWHPEVPSFGSGKQWKPSDRSLTFPPGIFFLWAQAQVGEERLESESYPLAVSPDEQPGEVILRLRPRSGIYGEVIVPSDFSLAEVSVRAACMPEIGPTSLKEIIEGNLYTIWLRTKAKREDAFRYALWDVRPGLYFVAAFFGPDGPLAAQAFVEVRDGSVRLDLELRPLAGDEGFAVRAYGPAGEVLSIDEEFSVALRGISTDGEDIYSREAGDLLRIPEADGSIRCFPPGPLEPFELDGPLQWMLEVYRPGYERLYVPFDPRKEREVEVRLQEPAHLTVSIEGYAESPYPRGEVSLYLYALVEGPRGHSPWRGEISRAEPDAEGRATFSAGVQPGRYELQVEYGTPSGGRGLYRTVHRSTVDLRSGWKSVSVLLPPLYDLLVSCPGCEEGERLTLCKQGDTSGWTVPLSRDRKAFFFGLPEGTYTLLKAGLRGGEMDVTVPGPRTVEFRPEPPEALRVDWVPEGSYLSELGFDSVRAIVGIGAELFEDARDFRRILEAAAAEEEIFLLVEGYGGRRCAVAVDPKRLLAEIERPGVLIPARRR